MSLIENDRFIDLRNFKHGDRIPSVNYCDQPYVTTLPNGEWLCTLTTGAGDEGEAGEFAGVSKSADLGKTWSPLVPLEDPQGPESSYSTPFVAPSGRIYIFYNYNGDNYRAPRRCDELGWYCYKFSDDNGSTWSKRQRIPMRMTKCDRENDFDGAVQLFWCISHPVVVGDDFYLVFSKMKTYAQRDNEGWAFKSPNILQESDPEKIEWALLPDGDVGILNPDFGRIQEEHNMVALSDGALYCIFRTEHGFLGSSVSSDGAHTWSKPEKVCDRYDRLMKNPQVCPKLWKLEDGRFMLWYHFNGIEGFAMKIRGYRGRNPVWLAIGEEREGGIAWEQPEILFYDQDERLGLSYPDMVKAGEDYYFFCTQKTVARSLKADPAIIAKMVAAPASAPTTDGLIIDETNPVGTLPLEWSPNLYQGEGITLDLELQTGSLRPGQVLLDNTLGTDIGFRVTTTDGHRLRFELCHLNYAFYWDTDTGLLKPNREHRIAFILDGGPKLLSVVIDGLVCDGGADRIFGWSNVPTNIEAINATNKLAISPDFDGAIQSLRIYNRYLLNLEVRNNHLA